MGLECGVCIYFGLKLCFFVWFVGFYIQMIKLHCLIFGSLYAKRKRIGLLIRKFNCGEIKGADYVNEIDKIVRM